ncbi:MAG: Trehalose/maltose import ATP-binding protein MalK [Methanosaeta sp. PtaU1.Bin112]|nr:MAG: Trehalose/maltose import ATP-binding protein MalK [Methanosaeta sp. PtaU1.Bin112]
MNSRRPDDAPILQIEDLSVSFSTATGQVKAAENVCFKLYKGETLALVGETGCGKSVVASSIMQLLPNNAHIQGRAIYAGRDLLSLSEKEMSRIRGSEIAIVFQNPSLALNPIMRVSEQIAEMLQVRKGYPAAQSLELAGEMLHRLGLQGDDKMRMYPFQFSGGMNQRVMIAASMILSPRIIIADEPSKGLDGALAAEVMAEMARIKNQVGASLLLITHDLNLARNISDRMAVMYCGEIMEIGESEEIFSLPRHPYTAALLRCLPERGFQPIPGPSPSMIKPPAGCKFHPRCPNISEVCRRKPKMTRVEGRGTAPAGSESEIREVKCWRY